MLWKVGGWQASVFAFSEHSDLLKAIKNERCRNIMTSGTLSEFKRRRDDRKLRVSGMLLTAAWEDPPQLLITLLTLTLSVDEMPKPQEQEEK